MSDPARVYARKYADLEAERDRYREALEKIASSSAPLSQDDMQIARDALDGPNGAPRETAPDHPQQLRIEA